MTRCPSCGAVSRPGESVHYAKCEQPIPCPKCAGYEAKLEDVEGMAKTIYGKRFMRWENCSKDLRDMYHEIAHDVIAWLKEE